MVLVLAVLTAAPGFLGGCNKGGGNAEFPFGFQEKEYRKNGVREQVREQESPDGENIDNTGERQDTEEKDRAVTVQLFFASQKDIERGERGEFGFVTPVDRTLKFKPGLLTLALEELIRGPLPGDGEVVPTLPPSTRILQVKIEGETAVVNLSREALSDSPGGTLGGTVFRQSLVCTAVQFPTVKSLIVLVNGEPWDDGHFIWDTPLEISDVTGN